MRIPFTENGQRLIGVCKFVLSGATWFDPEELERRKRVAAIIASSPKGPEIGMPREQARQSWWGMPKSVNSTTSAYGTREQWVYSIGRYLYFENGKLASIQKSR